jgi:iron complex transport system substrate-binding protein
MVCVLGLEDQLVGITHECDYPGDVQGKPVVVRNVLPIETMTQREIDQAVSERLKTGQSLYQVDELLLKDLAPDLILTQDLCQVCAPSGNELSHALSVLPNKPQVLWLTPKSLSGIEENILSVGEATGRTERAGQWFASARERLRRIADRTKELPARPRVFCMEWLDPVYCSGHWAPEMVRIAGGVDSLGQEGTDSVRISWDDVRRWDPDVLVVMPCGFHLDQVIEQAPKLFEYSGWADLSAVRSGRIYAVDASSYFARPGPRVVDGVELLAHIIHPQLFEWTGTSDAFRRLL